MTDQGSSAASGSTGPRRELMTRRDSRDATTPRAEVNRLAQAAFRLRQKARACIKLREKVQRLEAQVAALSERVAELHLAQASYRAQVDTLQSRYLTAAMDQRPQLPVPTAEIRPPGSEEVDDETAAMVARSLQLVQGPEGVPTSAAQCRFLTVDLLTGICLMRVERARQLLEAGADRANSDEAYQLELMIRDTTKMCLHLWRRNGSLVNRALGDYVRRAGGQDSPPADLHRRVMAALRLTNHQREGVLAAYAALSSQLNAAQQAFLTAERRATNSSPPVVGGSGANVVFATVEQASELCRTLDAAKRSAMFEYLQHCHMDVLSPLQVAWGSLAAYPYFMDMFELGAVLVAQTREPWSAGEDGVVAELLELLNSGIGSKA